MPTDVDVVVTHTPPWGVLDFDDHKSHKHIGSVALNKRLAADRPLLSCYGHIHGPGGQVRVRDWTAGGHTLDKGPFSLIANVTSHSPPIIGGVGRTVLVNGAQAVAAPAPGPGEFYPMKALRAPAVIDLVLPQRVKH
jgi:hypothetical protein